jgi:hypothetical protein
LYSAVSYGVLGLVMFSHAPSACASARFALAVISYSRASGRACVCCVCFVYVILFALGHRCDCPTHQIAQPGTHVHSMTIVYALPDRFA